MSRVRYIIIYTYIILFYIHTGRPGQYCILLLLSLWNRVLIPTDIINIHPGTPPPVFFLKNMFLMNLKGVWQIYSRGHIISLLPLSLLYPALQRLERAFLRHHCHDLLLSSAPRYVRALQTLYARRNLRVCFATLCPLVRVGGGTQSTQQ